MTEHEQALRALGRELDVPAAPDIVPAVLERIEPRRRPARWRDRRVALAIAIVLLAALAATLAVPEARSALFRILHLGGERIELVDELPPAEGALDESTLGEPVTLEEARSRAGFPLRELDERPDRVYLLGERPTVWFAYGPPGEVRLLVSQSPGLIVDSGLIAKKLVGPRHGARGDAGRRLAGVLPERLAARRPPAGRAGQRARGHDAARRQRPVLAGRQHRVPARGRLFRRRRPSSSASCFAPGTDAR